MNNEESDLEKVTRKILWDFEIQTDHQILARRSDLMLIKKDFAVLLILQSRRITELK